MGVNTFLLDRRNAPFLIGTSMQTAGTLRRFFKLTELNDERTAAQLDGAPVGAPATAALSGNARHDIAGTPNLRRQAFVRNKAA